MRSPSSSTSIKRKPHNTFSDDDLRQLHTLRPTIDARLLEFSRVPQCLWPRELLLCLLTPQSSPYRAEACLQALEARDVFSGALTEKEIAEELRESTRYIRFHNQKAARISDFVRRTREIVSIVTANLSAQEERLKLVDLINGFGLKEASHALRNIGRRELAILDRHILRNLVRLGVIAEAPKSLTAGRYREIEERFSEFSSGVGVPMDVLDLFFWARETGGVFK